VSYRRLCRLAIMFLREDACIRGMYMVALLVMRKQIIFRRVKFLIDFSTVREVIGFMKMARIRVTSMSASLLQDLGRVKEHTFFRTAISMLELLSQG
jgi:hypothetical protein